MSEINSVHVMNPHTIYFCISNLPEDKQIKFIKKNINYIKDNFDKVFLEKNESLKPLSYFLSFNVLKEIRMLDIDLFKKIIRENQENLFHSFNQKDYIEFYNYFCDEIKEIKNSEFIDGVHYHNRFCYEDGVNIENFFELQQIYNKEFMDLILEKYVEKISTFSPDELLKFIKNIEDLEKYKEIVNENYEKLNSLFKDLPKYKLEEYLFELNYFEQEILIFTFYDTIIKTSDISNLLYKLNPQIIIKLYNYDKELFSFMTLKKWIFLCSKLRTFNEDFKKIIDTYEINDIELLFDNNLFFTCCYKEDVKALMYVETKYRRNIKVNGNLEVLDKNISVFSERYIKNLKELRKMFENNFISRNDFEYKQSLAIFIVFLKNQNIINNVEGNSFKEIERLFYRIVMGTSLTVLYQLSNINDITILNRLGTIDFKTEEFNIEQLEKYNVKQHKKLYKKLKNEWNISKYKTLLLKLMLLVGYNHAEAILKIDDSLEKLEHLVGNVDVKKVILDEEGNPVLNTKIMNLLFNEKHYLKIKEMLSNKDDLYKYFPRIFNEWETIKINEKDKSLEMIIDFLKSDDIMLLPKYYRLKGLFKFIGCKNNVVNEAFLLHDQMLSRTYSSIPRIEGNEDGYSYEILKLNDMKSLVVGNQTECCFAIKKAGFSCLKHAVTTNNGRILVIRKNNRILGHSWVWRNGNLLCFDNIEVLKSINEVAFLNIYLQVADKIINKSLEEGKDAIENVTIGFNYNDKKINGIEKYPCLISKECDIDEKDFGSRLGKKRKFINVLPQPIEEVDYSDSKNAQYLIRGNGNFNLKQNCFDYLDERNEIMHYILGNTYEENYLKKMNKKVNALRYIQKENANDLDTFEIIDITNLSEVYCNDDWYIIEYLDGYIEIYNNSLDKRSEEEIRNSKICNSRVLKKNKM